MVLLNGGPTLVRATTARLLIVLLMVTLVTVPAVSGYLNKNIDMSGYVRDETCYCHGVEASPNVTVSIDVDDRVAYTSTNRSVTVTVGIHGEPSDITGFGLFLNASKTSDNVKWQLKYSNSTGASTIPGNLIKVNGTALWTVAPVVDEWFNVSFIPGSTDQEITVSVMGVKANGNDNETGDLWNIGRTTVEVRKQKLAYVNVTVTNTENIAVENVLVDFYIDDVYVGNFTVLNLPENGKENATLTWDVTFEKEGKHSLKTVIDPFGWITVADREKLVTTRDIWLGEPPEETNFSVYYSLVGVAAGILIIGLVFWWWRRRQYTF